MKKHWLVLSSRMYSKYILTSSSLYQTTGVDVVQRDRRLSQHKILDWNLENLFIPSGSIFYYLQIEVTELGVERDPRAFFLISRKAPLLTCFCMCSSLYPYVWWGLLCRQEWAGSRVGIQIAWRFVFLTFSSPHLKKSHSNQLSTCIVIDPSSCLGGTWQSRENQVYNNVSVIITGTETKV